MFVHQNSHKRAFGRGGVANSHRCGYIAIGTVPRCQSIQFGIISMQTDHNL